MPQQAFSPCAPAQRREEEQMILVELVAAAIFVGALCLVLLIALTRIPRAIQRWRYNRSIHGQIDRKQQQIDEQDRYIERLNLEILAEEIDARRELKTAYRDLAMQKR